MSIAADQILKVALGEDDFGHEMRVGKILHPDHIRLPGRPFMRARFELPKHGETYIDAVTGKSRQFDYRTRIHRNSYGPHVIALALECKNIDPDFPLIVSGRPRTRDESYHMVVATEEKGPALYRVSGESSIYKPDKFVGKSLWRLRMKDKRLSSDGDSEIYDRYSQALSSARDLALEAMNQPRESRFSFVMPAVVLPDDALWVMSYDEDGTPSMPEKAKVCDFFVGQKVNIGLDFIITHVRFLTKTGLAEMILNFANGDYYEWDQMFCITATKL